MDRYDVTNIQSERFEKMKQVYYAWIRHMVSLATGALTLLVALQNYYVAQRPVCIWSLKACWIALSVAILTGAMILFDEYWMLRRSHKLSLKMAATEPIHLGAEWPSPLFLLTNILFYSSLPSSLLFLVIFAIANLP